MEKITCSTCHQDDIQKLSQNRYFCNTCDKSFRTDRENIFIFISYGHDEYVNDVIRIRDDLRKQGFSVWFDEENIQIGDNPHEKIHEGLDLLRKNGRNSRFLLIVTKHSVRMKDEQCYGYCLNEMQVAKNNHVPILPLMLEETELPIDIARHKYLDMKACLPFNQYEEEYDIRFNSLNGAIIKTEYDNYWRFNDLQYLKTLLEPVIFDNEIQNHNDRFTGREWLIDWIRNWITNMDSGNTLLLVGDMGTGKSAVVSFIIRHFEYTRAFHLVKWDTPNKSDPKGLIKNLCFQLCEQFEEYKEKVKDIIDDTLKQTNLKILFEELIAQPLSSVALSQNKLIVIVIDALDEIRNCEDIENPDNILYAFSDINLPGGVRLPKGMKILLTARPEDRILQFFNSAKKKELEKDSPQNIIDISNYVESRIKSHFDNPARLKEASEIIVKKCEGIFLFAELIINEILEIDKSMLRNANFQEMIPNGLSDMYYQNFKRNYHDQRIYNKTIKKYFELTFASKATLDFDTACKLLKWNEEDKLLFVQQTGSMFTEVNGIYKTFHISLYDWLTDQNNSKNFYFDLESGHKFLSAEGLKVIENSLDRENLQTVEYLTDIESILVDELPFHLIRLQDYTRLQKALMNIHYLVGLFNKDKFQCIAYFDQLKNQDETYKTLQKAAHEFEKNHSDQYSVAGIYQTVGLIYFEKGENVRSEYFLKNAARISEELNDVHFKAMVFNGLAEAYLNIATNMDPMDQGNFNEAKKYYIKAINALWQYKMLSEDDDKYETPFRQDVVLAEYINNYGHYFFHNHESKKAERLYLTARKIRENNLLPYSKKIAESVFNCGLSKIRIGNDNNVPDDIVLGVKMIGQSLEIHKLANRYWDKDVALYKHTLADYLQLFRNYLEALSLCEEAFAIRLALFGSGHNSTKNSFDLFERIHIEMLKDGKRAVHPGKQSIIEKAIERRQNHLPKHSREIITLLYYQALILLYQGNNDKAIEEIQNAEKLAKDINLGQLEFLDVLLKNIEIQIKTKNFITAKEKLIDLYNEHVKNYGVSHGKTLEFFNNLMKLLFDLPIEERRFAVDFLEVLMKIADKLMKTMQEDEVKTDRDLIFNMAVAFNEISFHKYMIEKDWDRAIIFYKRALDHMRLCDKPNEEANMFLNLQLAMFWGGLTNDIPAIEKAKETLIEYGDYKKALKAAFILKSLYRDDWHVKVDETLFLNLAFACAISDTEIDALELEIIGKMAGIKKADLLYEEYKTLLNEYRGDVIKVKESLVKTAIEFTTENNFGKEYIEEVLTELMFVIGADSMLTNSEYGVLLSYAKQFGFSTEEVRQIIIKFIS